MRQVHVVAGFKAWIDEPVVNPDEFAKAPRQLFVALEVRALAPQGPTGLQRREQVLLVKVFEDAGNAGVQVVVEQDRAGVEVFHPDAAVGTHHRLQRNSFAAWHRNHRGFGQLRADRANANMQAGHMKNAPQLH